MLGKYLNPQNDVAFKHIFGKEKNKEILLALINSVLKDQLHQPIQEAQFLPRDQDPEIAVQKTSIVDVICKDQDGCTYIIEMQVAESEGFRERAQYYAFKAYIQQANRGDKYSKLEKVIFLAFTNYPIFPKKQNHKSNHQIRDVVTHEQDLDKLAFTFVDLTKFNQNKKPVEDLTLEEKFYFFLKRAKDITPTELEAITTQEPIMKKAFKALDRFYWTPQELAQYEDREKKEWDYRSALYQKGVNKGIEKGRQEGIEKGITEGGKKRNREIAKQMLAKGMNIKLIEELTGLTAEVISELKSV